MSIFTHEIMLKNEVLARINIEDGAFEQTSNFLPLDLHYNTMPMTITDRVKNVSGFMDWCSKRVLMMSQKHAKKICNALALSQENSTENKAQIALAYHCCTLTDSFWVKKVGSDIRYEDVSLFRNQSRNILTPVSLAGKSESLFIKQFKNWTDIGTDGTLAKSWIREGNDYYLCKTGDNMHGEVLASNILSTIHANSVKYVHDIWISDSNDKLTITKCKCFTNEEISFIPYKVYCNHFGTSGLERLKEDFMSDYANMAVATYLLGNEDLHDKNWGVLLDNHTKHMIGLAPLFDFDGCFLNYKTSKYLKFLPECEYITDNGMELLAPEFDIDECYDIVGPSIEEAALLYAPYCTYDLSELEHFKIPEIYKEEFNNRIHNIEQARNQPMQQQERYYEYES